MQHITIENEILKYNLNKKNSDISYHFIYFKSLTVDITETL